MTCRGEYLESGCNKLLASVALGKKVNATQIVNTLNIVWFKGLGDMLPKVAVLDMEKTT